MDCLTNLMTNFLLCWYATRAPVCAGVGAVPLVETAPKRRCFPVDDSIGNDFLDSNCFFTQQDQQRLPQEDRKRHSIKMIAVGHHLEVHVCLKLSVLGSTRQEKENDLPVKRHWKIRVAPPKFNSHCCSLLQHLNWLTSTRTREHPASAAMFHRPVCLSSVTQTLAKDLKHATQFKT